MVWRDVDFGVDAPGLTAEAAWETMHPALARCSSLQYANDHEDGRHYVVMRIDGWNVDVALWFAGLPPAVESFQVELPARLTKETRLTILRLKDCWHRLPHYPERVGLADLRRRPEPRGADAGRARRLRCRARAPDATSSGH
jgi:hypothetical protein